MKVKFPIDFDKDKNFLLKEIRGVSFEDVVELLKKENVLDDILHPNQKRYPNQRIFVIRIDEYIYSVPYVIDKKRKRTFLKTIYPNRVLTKKYLKGIKSE